jgi:septal ring-binding cell division protein DamX
MHPATFPLDLYRGDTYRLTARVWQDTAKTVPFNLAGAMAHAEIRDVPGGKTIVTMSCLVILPNSVEVVLTAPSSKLVPVSAVWDLQLTLVGGDIKTVVAGPVTNTPDVTDSAKGGCTPTTTTPIVTSVPVGATARRGF